MKKKKNVELSIKPLGLFDHVKHIRGIQDPNYYKNLSELDRKSFDSNHFMILKALSMNPAIVSDIADIFRFMGKIPSAQLYQLLIVLVPKDKTFYRWIKGKKSPFGQSLIGLIAQYFEISEKEATEYATLLSTTGHINELTKLCEDFGLNEKEVKEVMEGKNDNDE